MSDLIDVIARAIEPYPFEGWQSTFDADYPESIRFRDRQIFARRVDECRFTACVVLAALRQFERKSAAPEVAA